MFSSRSNSLPYLYRWADIAKKRCIYFEDPSMKEGDNPPVAYYDHDFEWIELESTAQDTLHNLPHLPPDEKRRYMEADPTQSWQGFYGMHTNATFFKARAYLTVEFPELTLEQREPPLQLLELGCGYGASLASIMQKNTTIVCHACDLSALALDQLKEYMKRQGVDDDRLKPFLCNVVAGDLPLHLRDSSVNFVLMTFMLSAVQPPHHLQVLQKARNALHVGGLLLFRDYGLYDSTQLRSKKRLGQSMFARQDGTLAYFFRIEEMEELLKKSGFEVLECNYATVRLTNRSTKEVMHRVFLHAKARRL